MTSRRKRLLKLLNQPKSTRFNDIHIVLKDFGYQLVRIKGSHHIFEKIGCEQVIIPVHNNEVKIVYIRKIIKILTEQNEKPLL